jgi:DNA modification methylase
MLLYSKEGDTIYDPFTGTGTTAIACIREKRNYVGSELSPRYIDWAEKRIKREQSQLTLW